MLLAHPTDRDKMFDFQKYTRFTQGLIQSLQDLQQILSLGINRNDNVVPCFSHDNIVGSLLCDECMKLILPNVFHKLESIW